MIKQLLLPLFLSAALFSACKKKDDSPPPTPEVRVDNVTDADVERYQTNRFQISVVAVSGQPTTTLSINGLPPGVTGYFDVASGTGSFSTSVTLDASGAAVAGSSSTATITATPSGGEAKTYNFKVLVRGTCVDGLAATYNVVNQCSGTGTSAYQSTLTADPDIRTRIRISNLNNTGVTVFAEVNCGTSIRFDIPQQVPPGANFSVTGNGLYSNNTLSLSHNIVPLGAGSAQNCNATYTR